VLWIAGVPARTEREEAVKPNQSKGQRADGAILIRVLAL
jgi:hypothetical protein